MCIRDSAKPAAVPGLPHSSNPGDEELLDTLDAKTYRSICGKLLHLSKYRFDIVWVVRDLCK
eukprot:1867730-Alexandrium_andersonii.AAC.1